MKSEHNILQTVAILVAIILIFGLAGSGDYADELAAENARLKAAAAHCRLATAMREVQP
jgi:hypothetical protein